MPGDEPVHALHPPPGRHHAADPGVAARRHPVVRPAAGGSAAQRRLPGHRGQRQPAGRQPGNHGLVGGHAAGALAGTDRRDQRDDLQQLAGLDHRGARVRPGEGHRRRRPRGAGGDQRRDEPAAQRHAEQSQLPQGQPLGHADHGPHPDLGDPESRRDVRPRLDRAGAEAVAGAGGRAGEHRRQLAAGGAGRPQPGCHEPVRAVPGQRAHGHRRGQQQRPQGRRREGRQALAGGRQRPVAQGPASTSRW
ncbi:Uncharacterised protein [Pseudomonas aeruginosa]|nr:Uncharacterised protein [Pseudomonas aeruginosa]